jgi:HlyD family secretion protein
MAARKKRRYIWVTLTLLLLAGAAIFSVKAIGSKPAKIDPEKIAKAERMDLARSVVATGKVQPVTQVEIKSKASGIIQKLPVNVGDVVHKGQVICELDQNDLIPALHQQEAAMHVAQAALKTAQADYERFKVDATGPDVPFLKRDAERGAKMFTDGLIAQNARDDAEKNYQMAVQKQESAKANLGSAAAAINKAEASLEQQQAALNAAEENLRNATIVSPIDGVVLSRDSEVGDAVSSILLLGSNYGGVFQGSAVPGARHEDFAHGHGKGQRDYVRGPRFDFQRKAHPESADDGERRDHPRRTSRCSRGARRRSHIQQGQIDRRAGSRSHE